MAPAMHVGQRSSPILPFDDPSLRLIQAQSTETAGGPGGFGRSLSAIRWHGTTERLRATMSIQPTPFTLPEPLEPFVDPDTAANYLQTTRRHVLEMVREGLIPGHPLDPHAKKKDWRFLLSELHAYMLSCDQRPPGAPKP